MTVTLTVVRPGAMTAVGTPTTTHDIGWRTEKNGAGSGQFSIVMADDPTYGDIQVNDVAKVSIDGTLVAGLLIEKIHERTLDEQGAARQTATYIGRLVGAFMEWAVVAPANGDQWKPIEDDAVFDWRSPRYDPALDSWVASNELITVTAAKAGGWPTTPMGQSFTDSTGAYMIWEAGGTTELADDGTVLFYRDITTTAGRHGLEVLMDNDGLVFVDGVQMLEINDTEGYHRASFKRIELSAGVHRFCFRVRNFNGPGALAYNLFKTDHQDRPLPGVAVVAISDDNTKTVGYVDAPAVIPGMTVGDILTQLVDEAQARGALTWIVPSFDAVDDSNGDPWDRDAGITTKTGTTTLLQFLDELVAAGHVSQWRVAPNGITLDVFAPAYTSATTVTLAPAPADDPRTGQVVELDRQIT